MQMHIHDFIHSHAKSSSSFYFLFPENRVPSTYLFRHNFIVILHEMSMDDAILRFLVVFLFQIPLGIYRVFITKFIDRAL